MSRKLGSFRVLAFVVLVGMMMSCAPKATPTAVPTKPPEATKVPQATPVPPTPTVVPTPKYGGTINGMTSMMPVDLDPHRVMSGEVRVIHAVVYSGLIRLTREGTVVPDLAESWETSSDGLQYTFHLRKGVKFHNMDPANGREVAAEDWVYSVKRMLSKGPEWKMRDMYASITNVEALDKYTVRITLKAPWSAFLSQAGGTRPIVVVPKEAVEKWGDLKEHAIGTGAFMLAEYDRSTGYRLVKNPNYWEEGLPRSDEYVVQLMPDASTRYAAFLSGMLSSTDATEPKKREQVIALAPGMQLFPGVDSSGIPMLFLNAKKKPFNDIRVRKAVHLALDRKKILDVFGFGNGSYVVGPIPPYLSYWALPEAELKDKPGFRYPKDADQAEARRLMEEAGYPPGTTTLKMYWQTTQDCNAMLFGVLKDRLEQDLGVKIEGVGVDTGAWLTELVQGTDWDIVPVCMNTPTDPDDHTLLYLPDGYGAFLWGMSDKTEPELLKVISEQRAATDPVKRRDLVWQAQWMMLDKCYGIYTVNRDSYSIYWPWAKGVAGGQSPVGEHDLIYRWNEPH